MVGIFRVSRQWASRFSALGVSARGRENSTTADATFTGRLITFPGILGQEKPAHHTDVGIFYITVREITDKKINHII